MYLVAARKYTGRDGIVQRGAAKGLKFNAGAARNAGFLLGTYEPEVQRIYTSLIKPGMTVYDVGANVGFLSMLAAKLTGPGGKVVCFEPLPSNADLIEHNAALNSYENVSVRREALGSCDETVPFHVSADSGWGRLARTGSEPPNELMETIDVPVCRLDQTIRRAQLPAPDLIKIDIEGAETEMLAGAREVLLHYRPALLIELHGTNEGVHGILTELNYRSRVLGLDCSILSAPWDAFIVAVPSEDTELCQAAEREARQAKLLR